MSDNKLIFINQDKNFRADAIRNRRVILDTALRLFNEQGVEAVTMSAIAQAAGVGKGTLYRNFQDKAELCHALLDEDMREFQQKTLTQMRSNAHPLALLRWFLEEAARYVVVHNELLGEVSNQGGVDMIRHPAHFWWWQTIHGLLTRLAMQEDIVYLADVFYMMLDVQTIRFQRRSQNYSLEQIIAGLDLLVTRLVPTNEAP